MLTIVQKLTNAQKNCLALAVFALLIALFYGNTLQNGFIYDDFQQIVENEYIHSLKYLPKVVTGCIWEHAFGGCEGRSIYYRPVQSLSYLLTWQISSSAWAFHLVNLFYFFAVVSLIFFLAKLLTNNFLFSFATVLLFLANPIHAEVVNWPAAVPELTFAIFVLLSAIFYIKHRQKGSLAKFAASAVFYFLAVMSKEPAIFLPALFLFIDWKWFKFDLEDFFQWKEVLKYFSLAAAALVYFLMRMAVLGGGLIQQGQSPHSPFSLAERLYSFFFLFFQYLEKLFWPHPRVFFYHFEKKSIFFTLEFLTAFFAVAIFIALAFFFYKKTKPLLVFSFLWLFIFLLPVLVFLESAGEAVFSERYLFIPGIGFAFIFGYLLTHLWQTGKKPLQAASVLILFAVLASALFFIPERNLIWKDNETMYTKTLAQNPLAYPIRFNYAVLLRNEKKDVEAAKREFETLLAQNPNWADVNMIYLHLGDYYRDKGEIEQATGYYQKSVDSAGNIWKGHFALNRLGEIYAVRENYLKALTYFCQAMQNNPEAETSQEKFNKVVSIIQLLYEKDPAALYGAIVSGDAFKKSGENKIVYKRKSCEEDICYFFFAPRFRQDEVVLPLLISASIKDGEAVQILDSQFNPEAGEAAIGVAPIYQNQPLVFIFPTCDGIYYEAVTE